MKSGAAVELTDINKTFDGVRVLTDLRLRVRQGSVHALLGGNGSGKSTTLKILAGVYSADRGGTIAVHARAAAAESWNSHLARSSGLRFVHQDLGLVPDLTVSENFALDGGYPRRFGPAISWRRLHDTTRVHMEKWQLKIDPRSRVRDLRPSDQTLVAIARALRDSDHGSQTTLVLDEPTASLPGHEAGLLLEAIRRCRAQGQTIIYVSHRLPEVLSIADHVSVLRDGVVVSDSAATDLDEAGIVELMAGKAADRLRSARRDGIGTRRLVRVTGLSAGPLRDVELDVRQGEIVGIGGLLGSGRSTLLRALFGDFPVEAGRVEIDGAGVEIRSVTDAMRHGVALVPEDRTRDAAYSDRPLSENLSAAVIRKYWSGWRMARKAEQRDAAHLMRAFNVKAATPSVPFGTLSGGNQQKAVLARWFRTNPRLLLLDEPTQGVDVMSRADIHEQVHRHVAAGNAALVVSSDFEELEALCDRVVILRAGRSVAQLNGGDLTEKNIAHLAHIDRKGP
ncbi:sugar ABC transporter ATP-binding protein [Micromonospora sp. NPDC047707]|uniref:sugar ABC transporter ATP-binding protein n=1 Tax=Micromonospora sp. NPDC047707 TaxID=3154498 RepID=UPI003456650C